jgi:hypothetical protein
MNLFHILIKPAMTNFYLILVRRIILSLKKCIAYLFVCRLEISSNKKMTISSINKEETPSSNGVV